MPPRDAAATRSRILDSAQRMFAQRGYAGVTVKGIADDAGVSPNLITRYFGGKDGLFVAATRVEILVDRPLEGDLANLGERLADSAIDRWYGPDEDPLLVLLRASGERPEAAVALADFLDRFALAPLEEYLRGAGLDADTARLRAEAIDTFMLGISARYRVLRPEPPEAAELRRLIATTVQSLAEG